MSSLPASAPAAVADDSFELYDLRVEVVCPPGERIMCGAKEGDYFTLEGEMMYLPPGQGISIYSLGKPENSRAWASLFLFSASSTVCCNFHS